MYSIRQNFRWTKIPPSPVTFVLQWNKLSITTTSASCTLLSQFTLGTCTRVTVVILCVCVVTTVVATYLSYTLKARCHQASRGDFNKGNVEFIENTCSKVMMTFADHLALLCFLMNSQCTKETAMASFQPEQCIDLAILIITQLTHDWLRSGRL